ncbi:MAG TPA: hypothetical protein VFG68_22095, partial [Fimbriiglobus sp.]|nr:hypothetical protein [Fimbriiglobus sp.]
MKRRRNRLTEIASAELPATNGHHRREASAPPDPAAVGSAGALFTDHAELHRLAMLRLNDMAAYAVEEERYKKQDVPARRLEQVTAKIAGDIRSQMVRSGNPAVRPDRPPYFVVGNVTYRANSPDVPLCNFTARIVADVTTDDGAECRRRLRLAGRL